MNTYLDANAGLPVSEAVIRGASVWGQCTNPSNTLTRSGKDTAERYAAAEAHILELLADNPDEWKLIVTSGSTEGIVTAITNAARSSRAVNEDRRDVGIPRILCLDGHHPCIEEIADRWPATHGTTLGIDYCGSSLLDVEEKLRGGDTATGDAEYGAIFITQVASLTGEVAESRDIAAAFKRYYPNGMVIVDGTQAVGKCLFSLDPITLGSENTDARFDLGIEATGADVYLFSGHKFGALKGSGGMLVRRTFLTPMIRDAQSDTQSDAQSAARHIVQWVPLVPGTQQEGLRGGTLNVQGLLSMELALTEALRDLPTRIEATRQSVLRICDMIEREALPRVKILAPDAEYRSLLARDEVRDDRSLPARDEVRDARTPRAKGAARRRCHRYTCNTILISIPMCSRKVAEEMCQLGYDIGIGTACQTNARGTSHKYEDPAMRKPYLIRISLAAGQTVEEGAFVTAFRTAFTTTLQKMQTSLEALVAGV